MTKKMPSLVTSRRSFQEDLTADTKMSRTVLRCILLFGLVNVLYASPRRSNRIKIDPNYLKALLAYKKLEPKMTRSELKTIATIGILNGALKAEKEMEKHLTELVTDLILNTNISDKSTALPKVTKIEETIERDKNAVQILTSAMDLATKSVSMKEYKEELQKTLDEHKSKKRETGSQKKDIDMPRLKAAILDHVLNTQRQILKKIDGTLRYLQENKELDVIKVNRKRDAEQGNSLKDFLEEDKVENNLIDSDNKSTLGTGRIMNTPSNIDTNETFEININEDNNKTANQLDESDDDIGEGDAAPGGLVALIASLSGGEGGSDVGALVGALTGVIAQIFGPGGLDIESLISTGTSLISGLLSGDKNFGTVLGEYVGTAFDGLSGGGGAINNGKFIGNLLGTIVASLSADPEDDDLPPKPFVFLQTLLKTFQEAKNRAGTPEEGGEPNPAQPHPMGGSDSFGFVKQIISALVGGVTSLVLNAALGASGGSSQASTSVIASSSHPHHPPAQKPTW